MRRMQLTLLLAFLTALLLATQAGRIESPAAADKFDPDDPFGGTFQEVAKRRRDGTDFDALVQLSDSTIDSAESDQLQEPPLEPFSPALTEAEVSTFVIECLLHILEDPDFRRQREFYGTPGDDVVVLVNDSGLPWPAGVPGALGGYRLEFGSSEMHVSGVDHRMAIRLDEVDVIAPHSNSSGRGWYAGNSQLSIYSLQGTGSTLVIGGCFAWFDINRVDGELVVTPGATLDP